MQIDFDKLLDDNGEAPTNPREIFLTLDKATGFSFLRDIQSDVLDAWYARPDERDTVIKLNVGSGKTLVGLLVLQSSLNGGVGPAVYVAPDNLLVQQVVAEAERLGISVATDESDLGFASGRSILVINAHKLFNGRSVFGIGAAGVKIPIESIVIDDAHACLSTITKQFRIWVPNTHPVYEWSLKTFSPALKRQSASTLLSIESADPQYYLEAPFWSVQEHADDLLKVIHSHRDTDELRFTYPS